MGKTIRKISARRCGARHPMYGKQVRCEEPIGHRGEHFHSFYMRSWDNAPPRRHIPPRVIGGIPA